MAGSIYKNKRNIGSVEELQKNVKTMKPGIWILIVAILTFLIGMIVFICTTTYSSAIPVFAYADQGIVHYYVKEENAASIKLGQKVTYTDSDIVDMIASANLEPMYADQSIATKEMFEFGDYTDGDMIYELFSEESEVTPGYHEAYIYIEEYSLIESFFN